MKVCAWFFDFLFIQYYFKKLNFEDGECPPPIGPPLAKEGLIALPRNEKLPDKQMGAEL